MKVYFISILVATFNLQITMELEASLSRQKRWVSKPYYFGTTHLMCMRKIGKKGKRSAPSRYTLRVAHRFIYYDGWYFEFGKFGGSGVGIFNGRARASDRCPSRRERRPAGYSRVSVDCLKRCTNSYRRRYGKYNLLFNNCHHFANRLARVLYYYSTGCPSWCY